VNDYFLSVAEAAAHIGVSTKTIRNYIECGRLKAERLGPRRIVITLDAIDGLYTDYIPPRRRGYAA
jgi:excisionase family DNA binding protein